MRNVAGLVAIAWIGFLVWAAATAPPRDKGPPPIMPGKQARLTDDVYGCDRPQYDRLGDFVVAGDRAAFGSYLAEQMIAGTCTKLDSGTVVHVEDVAVFAGVTKLRQRGSSKSWWVTTRALAGGAVEMESGRIN